MFSVLDCTTETSFKIVVEYFKAAQTWKEAKQLPVTAE